MQGTTSKSIQGYSSMEGLWDGKPASMAGPEYLQKI